jgi:hypothetical protein
MIKIGDRVRFLSDVGGGIVKGFKDKKTALVEDEDGFEIPVLISECVAIETDDYNIAKVDTMGRNKKQEVSDDKPLNKVPLSDDEDYDPADRPVTFKPKPEERRDGDKLNVFVAFVPQNSREISSTSFDTYIVNDCNYYISYTYMSVENNAWTLRSMGTIEPNTKIFIEEFQHRNLNELSKVAVQLIAYKEDKTFLIKSPVSTEIRIDGTKFFKLHSFQQSIFFDEPALVYDIVKDDKPARPLVVDAVELKKAMTEKAEADKHAPKPARETKKIDRNGIVEVDLHIGELLETTAGMTPADMKEYQMGVFRRTMQEHIREKGRRIVFIHGKGEGVLRNAILDELKHKYKTCAFQDASFQQYGFGATMVIIH